MLNKLLVFWFLLIGSICYGQIGLPLNVAVKYQISNPGSSGTSPNFTVSGFVTDDLTRWDATSVHIGDSLYVLDNSEVYVFVVASIPFQSGNSLTINVTAINNELSLIPPGQAAIIHPTSKFKYPTYISTLRDDLRAAIMNRFSYMLDAQMKAGDKIVYTIGATAPANSLATVDGYRFAKNNNGDGDFYIWNGTAWVLDKITSFTSGGALGFLEIVENGITYSVAITDIAPVQDIQAANNDFSVVDNPGGVVTLKLAQQGATTGQVLKWNGTQWEPAGIKDSTTANNGISVSGLSLQLGDAVNGTSSSLTSTRKIPLNSKKIIFSTPGQVIMGTDTASIGYSNSVLYENSVLTIGRGTIPLSTDVPQILQTDTISSTNSTTVWTERYLKTPLKEFTPYREFTQLYKNVGGAGYNNCIYQRGVNVGATGRLDNTKPAMREQLESKFLVSGHGYVQEWWRSMQAIDGTESRFEYFIANRDNLSKASMFWQADGFSWQTPTGYDGLTLTIPRSNVAQTSLSLAPANGNGNVFFDMYGPNESSNKIRMKRPIGATGSGAIDDILTYSYSGTTPLIVIGSLGSNWIGLNTEKVMLRPSGGRTAIVRNTSSFTLFIGTTTDNSLFSDATSTTMQINGGSGLQGAYPNANGGNDILRLWHNSKSEGWGLGVETNGFTIGKAQATPGLYTAYFRDQTATDFNLKLYGTASIIIPVGTTAQRPIAANGIFRFNTTTNKYEGSTNGTTWSDFATGSFWSTAGNTASTPDFFGSVNNVSIRFKTANVQRMKIDSVGLVGIGTETPGEKLDVNGQGRFDAIDLRNWTTTENANSGEIHYMQGSETVAPYLTVGNGTQRFALTTKAYDLQAIDFDVNWTTGRTKAFWTCPSKYSGWYIYAVTVTVNSVGTGTNTLAIEKGGVTQSTITLTNSDHTYYPTTALSTGDVWTFNVTGVSGTPPKGLNVELELRKY